MTLATPYPAPHFPNYSIAPGIYRLIKERHDIHQAHICGGSSVESVFKPAPLKPATFGRNRHELDSPNLDGHLPPHHTSCYNLPLGRTEMGCGLQG
ncbi:hypothetical protein AVEN_187823-1 [Araneus ventricosus]|uniref:Uncharacterized protein n=1 Tax=Araneus ventricosus TaxID=182803 RepID=A0A4Y2M773_ARAVE|nr:hypothetical protein AVEN_187823-1 [Araneus ventricosus]